MSIIHLRDLKLADHQIRFGDGYLYLDPPGDDYLGSWHITLTNVDTSDMLHVYSSFAQQDPVSVEAISRDGESWTGKGIVTYLSLDEVRIQGTGPMR